MTGAELIAAERQRHVSEEGWAPEHDAKYVNSELLEAAGAYELASYDRPQIVELAEMLWPRTWDKAWFKPTTRIRNLVKAGALIAAEIDRLEYERIRLNNTRSVPGTTEQGLGD